ncbi:alpha/beta-Hydrolases superfamily protein [Perilla frutescens var. frutescens]|nr:alpha/beta-Hydrolases superfamily protein [Perilla frutescens var. frutescens]
MGASCFSVASLCATLLRRAATAAGLTSQTVDIDADTTIHFWGPPAATSKPKLVLIHGFGPPSLWQWRQQAAFFTGEYDVYMPDLVFFGESFSKSLDRSEVFQAACMARLLENLGVTRYSVVGTSYGGFVAYRLASMWPERVEKVVIASSAVNMRRSDNVRLMQKADVDKIEDLLLPVNASQMWSSFRFVVSRRVYMPNFVLNDFINKLYSENRKEKLELLKELTIGKDETVNLSPLSQEVLIVWGENDQIFPLEKTEELKKLLGEKARLQVIKKGSHVPQLEHASQFNKILNNFLHELS